MKEQIKYDLDMARGLIETAEDYVDDDEYDDAESCISEALTHLNRAQTRVEELA